MHNISFDRTGNITLDDSIPGATPLTDAAYDEIKRRNIQFVYEMEDDFNGLSDGSLGLVKESDISSETKIGGSFVSFRMNSLIETRPDLVERKWTSFQEVDESIHYPDFVPKMSQILDKTVIWYMSRTAPVWTINEITAEAATLIATAKLDESILSRYKEESRKGIYLKAKKGYLLDAISEIMIIDDIVLCGCRLGANAVSCFEGSEQDVEYAAKFLALQAVENKPVVIRDTAETLKRKKGVTLTKGINTRTVSLSSRYRYKQLNSHEKVFSDWKEGKIKTVVSVSGFIREQAYGEGRKLRKTIWVDGFERGQWIRQGLSIVTVKE